MKKTIIDQIEITRVGQINIRMVKQIVDGDDVIDIGYHRILVEVGGDVGMQMSLVNEHLQTMGFLPVESGEIKWLQDISSIAFISEKITINETCKEVEQLKEIKNGSTETKGGSEGSAELLDSRLS